MKDVDPLERLVRLLVAAVIATVGGLAALFAGLLIVFSGFCSEEPCSQSSGTGDQIFQVVIFALALLVPAGIAASLALGPSPVERLGWLRFGALVVLFMLGYPTVVVPTASIGDRLDLDLTHGVVLAAVGSFGYLLGWSLIASTLERRRAVAPPT